MTSDHLTDVLHHVRKLTAAPAGGDLTDGELLERFCRAGEETAFALIVQRHGPLVLSVCRRVAQDSHEAEDAFQATFLVLVRKARAIRKQSSLAGFLQGVARRIALQARLQIARRQTRERHRLESVPPEPWAELTVRELSRVLDEELTRLPDRYRAPVILCYLEGKTQEQAARELGCPRTSLASRLGRALGLLHRRLTRRGVSLSAAGLAAALTGEVSAAPLPATLTLATVRTAIQGLAGGVVRTDVAVLAQHGVPPMLSTQRLTGFTGLLATMVLAVAGYVLSSPASAPPPAARPEAGAPSVPREDLPGGARRVTGLVVDAAGKPVAQARVWLTAFRSDDDTEVIDQGTTDEQGRFDVTVPARWFETPHSLRPMLGLIAHRPGRRMATLTFSASSVPPTAGTRLVLEAPAEATVRILSPDGAPIANARVEVLRLASDQVEADVTEEYLRDLGRLLRSRLRVTPVGVVITRLNAPLPKDLSGRFAGRSDANGRVTLPGLAQTDLGCLRVTAEGFGEQSLTLLPSLPTGENPSFPDAVRLLPVGRVSGRLDASPELANKRLIRVTSREDQRPVVRGPVYHVASAEVVTDKEGRFEVPALAAGLLEFRVVLPPDAGVLAREPAAGTLAVRAGERTDVRIPLRPGVRLGGVVRERGTGKPVGGVRVHLEHGERVEVVETDAAGRYTCRVSPGEVLPHVQVSHEFVPPTRAEQGSRRIRVAEGKVEQELPPLELTRAVRLRGTVVGEDGKAVPGALVHACWQGTDFRSWAEIRLEEASLTTNDRGEFSLEGLDGNRDVRLTARLEEAATAKAVVVRAGAGPLTLRLARGAALALAGRVRDGRGGPVAGGRIEVWARPGFAEPNAAMPRAVPLGTLVRTGADGKFQTPRRLVPDGFYRVVVSADGYQNVASDWLPVGADRPLAFPDLVLPRRRTLHGRVLDRTGRPVGGVLVVYVDDRQRSSTKTDADGRYRLEGVPEGTGFLFAEKAGFRFHGQATEAKSEVVEAVLTPRGERPTRGMPTVPSTLTKKEWLALAARVLEPALQQALAQSDDDRRLRPLELLARLDPGRVLEQIDRKAVRDPWKQDYLRRAVARTLLETSPDEARTVIDAMTDPGFRSMGYCDLCDSLPATKRKEKLDLLGQALLHARAVKDASHRVVGVAGVARRLRVVGEKERADRLLREHQPAARELATLAWSGYARGAFAEELALTDLPAALALIQDLNEKFAYHRHHGNIAHKLAGVKPAEAERILKMLGPSGRYPERVCYRMAPVDLERARRIADANPYPRQKARAYGVMAQALAGTKPARAVELLDQAFALLTEYVASGQDRFDNATNAPVVAAALLPVAEQIDPGLVPEFFWRTLSLRTPIPRDGDRGEFDAEVDAALALMIARYDRATARRLLEPVIPEAPRLVKTGRGRALISALAAVDPRWAVEVLEGLPGSLKEQERTRTASTISLSDAERWRDAFRAVGLWFVDDEDL
jgi:RNA polymerase sigma factor (sigma-70 family)